MPRRSTPTLASLYTAIQKKDADRVNSLLQISTIYESVHINGNDILRLAADKGDPRIVAALLAVPAVRENAHALNNEAFIISVTQKHTAVSKLLLDLPCVRENAHVNDNEALIFCAENNMHELTRELLMLPNVCMNAHVKDNWVLWHIACFGQVDLVNTLLALPHVRGAAHACNNKVLYIASKKGRLEIVTSLLSIPAVSANAHLLDNKILRVAMEHQYYGIIEMLLAIPTVKASFQVKGNSELFHLIYGPTEIVKTLLEVNSAKEKAHIKSNEILYLAAQAGNAEMVNLLLAIPKVAKNAHAKNNRALLAAIQNGRCEIVKTLLLNPNVSQRITNDILFQLISPFLTPAQLNEIVENLLTIVNVQQGLMKVDGKNIIQFFEEFPQFRESMIKNVILNEKWFQCYLNTFVERPDTWLLTQAILDIAIKENRVNVCQALLAIPVVKENVKLDTLRMVAINGNVEIMELLLAIPRMVENIHDRSNTLLLVAIRNAREEMVSLLLTHPLVRATAHNPNNFLLAVAVVERNASIVKILLTIPMIRKNVHVRNNFILHKAVQKNSNDEVVKELLKIPEMKQSLLSDNEQHNLVHFFEKYPTYRHVISESVTLYGVPLSWVLKDVPADEQVNCLKNFIQTPICYLENARALPPMVEAVRILYTEQLIANYKYQQAQREHFNNVDDEQRIDAVRKHYLAIIKPYFQEKYERQGLHQIEIAIRTLLLNTIMDEAKEKCKDNPEMNNVIAFIDSLDEEAKSRLLFGDDQDAMAQARAIFNSAQSEAQTAWRAYDPWAPVGGAWPNLLTPPLEKQDKAAFTVNTVGLDAPTIQTASDLVREMFAYSYLLVKDQEGTIEEQKLRETTFIAKVAETRRAHNQNTLGVDDPSCLPGSISRVGDTWIAHSKSVIPDVPQLLVEELRTIVLEKFQKLFPAEQDKFYNALVMLNQYNAIDVIIGKATFTNEDVLLRQQFRDNLENYGELYSTLNQALQKRGSRALNQNEFDLYVIALLMNLGGPWISQALTDIYRKGKEELLENPYTYVMGITSNQLITKAQAITLLQPSFQSMQIENKNTLLLQTAENLVNGKLEDAISHLKEKGITQEELAGLELLIVNYYKAKESALKEKSLLWDSLYHQFRYTPMRDMGASLRKVVNGVVDSKQELNAALHDEDFPSVKIINRSKRKPTDDDMQPSEEKAVRTTKKYRNER